MIPAFKTPQTPVNTSTASSGVSQWPAVEDHDHGITAASLGAITGTGTATEVAFFTGPTAVGSDSALYWDNTNKRLGIGRNDPLALVDVRGSQASGIFLERTAAGFAQFAGYRISGTPAANDGLALYAGGSSHDGTSANRAATSLLGIYAAETWTASAKGSYITLETTPTGSITRAERVRVSANGLVAIGNTVPVSLLHVGDVETPFLPDLPFANNSKVIIADAAMPSSAASNLLTLGGLANSSVGGQSTALSTGIVQQGTDAVAGFDITAYSKTTGSGSIVVAVNGGAGFYGSGTLAQLVGLRSFCSSFSPFGGGVGTTTDMIGMLATTNNRSAGTVDNNYGVYLESQDSVATANYQLYSAGLTSRAILLGGLSVGADVATVAGVINASVGYRVANAATSGNVLRGNGTNFIDAKLGASDVSIATDGGSPTVDTIQEYFDNTGSSGFFTGGEITDAGGGSINVAAGEGFIRATASDTAPLLSFKWSAAGPLAVPSNTTRWVFASYNAGSPTIVLSASEFDEAPDKVLIGLAVNEGGSIHHKFNLGVRLEESIGQAGRFLRRVLGIVRDTRRGGLVFGETGTRNVTLTAGTLWWGRTEYPISALDTSVAGSFTTFFRDGVGGFTSTAGVTQWPNTQYDDGSGTLVTMTNNRWAVLWFYIEADNEVSMVYGRNQYTSQANAEAETAPSTLPERLQNGSILAARFVFQKSAATASITTAFQTFFASSGGGGITAHADLSGLGNDDHTQYALLAGRAGNQTLIGGTAANGTLKLQATSGAGVGSEFISFLIGNNGAFEAMRIVNDSTPQATVGINMTPDGTSQFMVNRSDNLAGGAIAVRRPSSTAPHQVGRYDFVGRNSTPADRVYGRIETLINAGSAGSERGKMNLSVNHLGTITPAISIFSSATLLSVELGPSAGTLSPLTPVEVKDLTGADTLLGVRSNAGPITGVQMHDGTNFGYIYLKNPQTNGALAIHDGTNETIRLKGLNMSLGLAGFPSSGTNALIFADGTAPSSLASNTAGLYADDVGGTVKMFAIDEDGYRSPLSRTIARHFLLMGA